MIEPGGCLTDAELRRVLDAPETAPTDAGTEGHLGTCGRCRSRLEEFAGGTAWIPETAASGATGVSSGARPLPEIAGHEIESKLGSGGMGIVFRARDRSLGRPVAVKVLAPQIAASASARDRFLREARAAAAVHHPKLVTIHSIGETTGDAIPYLVMEFVEGESLAERIARGPIPFDELARVADDVAEALEAVHAGGIVHRDIKPANVLIDDATGSAKVTDFGLARAAEDALITRQGQLPGTPEYMSPEQAAGEAADSLSDLWAFGCVLYEMASGKRPFAAESPLAVLRKVAEQEPEPLENLAPDVPDGLRILVRDLLAKDPSERPRSATEVRERLAGLAATRGTARRSPDPSRPAKSRPDGRRARGPAAAAAAGLVVSGLGVAAIIWDPSGHGSSADGRWRSPPPPGAPPSASPGLEPVVVPAPALGRGTTTRLIAAASGDAAEHDQLEDAVAAAQSGDVLELDWDGPIESEPFTIRPGALTIRAAPGRRPILVFTPPVGPILDVGPPSTLEPEATLRIEGLELHWLARPRPPERRPDGWQNRQASSIRELRQSRSLILAGGHELEVVGCRLVIDRSGLDARPRPDPWRVIPGAADRFAISAIGSNRLLVRDTAIFAPEGVGIEFTADATARDPDTDRLSIENTLVVADVGLGLVGRGTGTGAVRLERTTLVARQAIAVRALDDGAAIQLEPSHTGIHAETAVHGSGRLRVQNDDGLARVRWRPRGPVRFDCRLPVDDGSGIRPPADDPLALWTRYWGEPAPEMRFEPLSLDLEDWTERSAEVLAWRVDAFSLRTEAGTRIGFDPAEVGPARADAVD